MFFLNLFLNTLRETFFSLLLDRASATVWSFRHFLELLLGPNIRWRKLLDPPSARRHQADATCGTVTLSNYSAIRLLEILSCFA